MTCMRGGPGAGNIFKGVGHCSGGTTFSTNTIVICIILFESAPFRDITKQHDYTISNG